MEFGGMERVKEECRHARGLRMLDELRQDVRYGLRRLRRNPGFTTVVVLTLAVAIGTTTTIYSTIDMAWHIIPVRQDRLVFVALTDVRLAQAQSGISGGLARSGASVPDLADWSAQTTTFEEFALWTKFKSRAGMRTCQIGPA